MSAEKDVKISPENILGSWGAVEDWSDGTSVSPTGWLAEGAGGAIARESSVVDAGLYSMKIAAGGATYGAFHPIANFDDYAGRTMRYGAKVLCGTGSKARIYMHDGTTKTASSYHTGSGEFELLEVSAQVGVSNSYLRFGVEVGAGVTGYFDSMIAVEGQTLFFSMQGERIDLREVDVSPATPVTVTAFDVARKEGQYVAATKMGPRRIRLRLQLWGDTMEEARTTYNSLIRAVSGSRKDLYIANDRLMKVDLTAISRVDFKANFNVYNVDLDFLCGQPYDYYIGRLRKKQTVNASPTSFSLDVLGNFITRPQISFYAGSTLSTVTLENQTTGQLMTFGLTIANGSTLFVDCEDVVVLNNAVDGISAFTGDFMHLAPGTNNLRITGSTPLTVSVDYFDKWL